MDEQATAACAHRRRFYEFALTIPVNFSR